MNEASRISHRAIALEAGVSQATVSRALKNDARISEAVRSRVQEIAAQMGYQPDPMVSKLMAHMRSMQETHFQSLLGFILPVQEYRNAFMREMVLGARERAEALGYVANDFRTGLGTKEVQSLNRIFTARGVEGIVFFPRHSLEAAPIGINLTHMAAVSCASFEGDFPLHHVGSDHFRNMNLVLQEVERRGRTRPGLVSWKDFDRRQRWAPRMGYYYFYHDIVDSPPPPVFDWHDHIDEVGPAFLSWFDEVCPDVLLVVGPVIADAIRAILTQAKRSTDIPIIGVGHTPAGYCGINEKAKTIGSAAIDILTSHIVRNEKGWPKDIKAMAIPGELRAV